MNVKITLGTVETGIISKGPNAGKPYGRSAQATVHWSKKGDKVMNVMSFSPQFASIADQFVEGATIEVSAMPKDGSVLILGPAREAAPAEAAAA
jgi:hypothetical protein